MKYLIKINKLNSELVDHAGLGEWTNNGVIVQPRTGVFGGGALKFTPGNYLVQTPSECIDDQDFTLACWIKSLGVAVGYETIYATLNPTPVTFFTYDTSTGGMSVSAQSYPYTRYFQTNNQLVAVKDKWMYYAVTRQDGTSREFINGKLVSTAGNFPSKIAYTSHDIGIAELSPSNTGLNAYVDDFNLIKGKALWTADFEVPKYYLDSLVFGMYDQNPEIFGMK